MIHKLRAEITERQLNGNYLQKPSFEDPDLDMVYGRIGLKENWEEKIEKAKNDGLTIKAE
jgi:hypothetical protein